MARLPRASSREVVRALQRAGFVLRRQTGSHAILRHADGRATTVPLGRSTMKLGTLRSILRDAVLDVDEFIDLL